MQEQYREVTTTTGTVLKVYAVPQTLIWSAQPRGIAKPPVPLHTMKTATGVQERLAKEGDPEWEPYLRVMAEYDEAQEAVQTDLTLVLALRDFEWPESPIAPPSYLQVAVQCGVIVWPDDANVIAQRGAYIRAMHAPSATDIQEITNIVSLLGGLSEELITQMRDRFQRRLRAALLSDEPEVGSALEPVVEAS